MKVPNVTLSVPLKFAILVTFAVVTSSCKQRTFHDSKAKSAGLGGDSCSEQSLTKLAETKGAGRSRLSVHGPLGTQPLTNDPNYSYLDDAGVSDFKNLCGSLAEADVVVKRVLERQIELKAIEKSGDEKAAKSATKGLRKSESYTQGVFIWQQLAGVVGNALGGGVPTREIRMFRHNPTGEIVGMIKVGRFPEPNSPRPHVLLVDFLAATPRLISLTQVFPPVKPNPPPSPLVSAPQDAVNQPAAGAPTEGQDQGEEAKEAKDGQENAVRLFMKTMMIEAKQRGVDVFHTSAVDNSSFLYCDIGFIYDKPEKKIGSSGPMSLDLSLAYEKYFPAPNAPYEVRNVRRSKNSAPTAGPERDRNCLGLEKVNKQ